MRLATAALILAVLIFAVTKAGYTETCGKITSWQEEDVRTVFGVDPQQLLNDADSFTHVYAENREQNSNCSSVNKTILNVRFNWAAAKYWNIMASVSSYGDDNAANECLGKSLAGIANTEGKIIEQRSNFVLYYKQWEDSPDQGLRVQDINLLAVHQGCVISIFGYWAGSIANTDQFLNRVKPVGEMTSYFNQFYERAKALINSKCALSACATGKMTLPSELSYLFYHQYDYSPLDGVVFGTDPALVRPLYIGKPEGELHFDVGFCEFNEPVDIYLACQLGTSPAPFYYIDSNRKARYFGHVSTSQISPFLSNLKQPTSVTLGGNFGGLFQGLDNLPKGPNEFYLGVVPSGGSFSDLKLIYHTMGTGECAGLIPVPTGKQIWFHAPVPVPVFGMKPYDPSKLRPLAVGPIALGENQIAMYMDICPFDLHVDTHFAVYCPEEDAVNVYFLTLSKILDLSARGSATSDEFEELLWEKVPLSNVLDGFPQECWDKQYVSDRSQYGHSSLLIPDPLVGMPASATQRITYYMFAVTPDGVRDKFYAWVTTLPINVRHAISETIRMLEGIQ